MDYVPGAEFRKMMAEEYNMCDQALKDDGYTCEIARSSKGRKTAKPFRRDLADHLLPGYLSLPNTPTKDFWRTLQICIALRLPMNLPRRYWNEMILLMMRLLIGIDPSAGYISKWHTAVHRFM
jgi:hypothetical protein